MAGKHSQLKCLLWISHSQHLIHVNVRYIMCAISSNHYFAGRMRLSKLVQFNYFLWFCSKVTIYKMMYQFWVVCWNFSIAKNGRLKVICCERLAKGKGRFYITVLCLSFLSVLAPDNEGTDFIFAFGSNYKNSWGSLEVYIATRYAHAVHFNYSYGNIVQVIPCIS